MFSDTVLQGTNTKVEVRSNCECSNKGMLFLLLFKNIAGSYDFLSHDCGRNMSSPAEFRKQTGFLAESSSC
jgi:hypothetical protein